MTVLSIPQGEIFVFFVALSEEWKKSEIKGFYHDNSLLFDDDGRVYIVYGNREIHLTELDEEACENIREDYVKARRAWIAEIRKDAEKEYSMGDVGKDVFEDFLEKLDHEIDYEN